MLPPRDKDLVLNAHSLRRHQIIPQTTADMQHVLGLAAQLLKHVLEALHARLVALRLLRREDGVERRAQLVDVVPDLVVRRVGQDDQFVLFGQARQARGDVGVRAPGWDGLVKGLGQRRVVGDGHARAGSSQRVEDHVAVGFVGPHDFVDAVAAEEVHEALEDVGRELWAVDFACLARHVEVNERAVAVKGDVFGLEGDFWGRHGEC